MEEAGVPAAKGTGVEEGAESRVVGDGSQEASAITSCDLAMAECRLDEGDWRRKRAPLVTDEHVPAGAASSPQENVEKPGKPAKLSPTLETWIDLIIEAKAAVLRSNISGDVQEDDSRLSCVTWNIDGLDQSNVKQRARRVCSYLDQYSPDVVFLQEVIPPYLVYLETRAVSYTIITGNEDGYFTAIMLKKSKVKTISHEVTPFPSSRMFRNLLTVHINVCGNNLCLMTSHLESKKAHSNERLTQLKLVLKKMKEAPETSTVLFAGDTNLRDPEVAKIGGLPRDILDVWEFLGEPEHCRYTWDTTINNNLEMRYASRLRFDRIFTRAANNGDQFIPRSLDLIGLERLPCRRFPSDHWGLLCVLDVQRKA